MDKKYWVNKWESDDIAFHEKTVNADLIRHLDELKLSPGNTVFVPLCGKTKDMIYLAEKEFNVIGIEFSQIACNDFFRELKITPHTQEKGKFTIYEHENIKIFCGDLFDLTPSDLPKVNAVYDCKSLIALPPELRAKYLNHIILCTGTHIKILLLTRESDCQVIPPPYPVNKSEVTTLFGHYFVVQLLKSDEITDIPERLIKKGYKSMIECVYLISEK